MSLLAAGLSAGKQRIVRYIIQYRRDNNICNPFRSLINPLEPSIYEYNIMTNYKNK